MAEAWWVHIKIEIDRGKANIFLGQVIGLAGGQPMLVEIIAKMALLAGPPVLGVWAIPNNDCSQP